VAKQFGDTAAAYMTSTVHATGADLETVQGVVRRYTDPMVLDLGCGAGHISFAVSPVSASVTAYDLSEKMLAVVAEGARSRTLDNIATEQGVAEKLPFPDGTFEVVITRFSAHHWGNVPVALSE